MTTIFDTDLELDLDQFQTIIDRRLNSWFFSNARDLRSKLRHHFTDSAKTTKKKYTGMPLEEYETLIKTLFEKCDEHKSGKLNFPQFEKFCSEGARIDGKD